MAQITLEQRKAIFKYKDKGFKNNKIAELIGVHPSSIRSEEHTSELQSQR